MNDNTEGPSSAEEDIRFAELDKRYAAVEKRIDDVKWLIGSLAGLFTVLFGVMTLILSWNYNNERTALREFQKDLREDLGKAQPQADLELLGSNGQPLTGQRLNGEVERDENGYSAVSFRSTLRNKGSGSTGQMFIKMYTGAGLPMVSPSTDEPKFAYEVYFSPKDFEPNELPGQFSSSRDGRIVLHNKAEPSPGVHPVMIKVYFGKGRVTQAAFEVIVPAAAK